LFPFVSKFQAQSHESDRPPTIKRQACKEEKSGPQGGKIKCEK
jgi:hypothetical protein